MNCDAANSANLIDQLGIWTHNKEFLNTSDPNPKQP